MDASFSGQVSRNCVKNSIVFYCAGALVSVLIAGCSDPADKVHKTSASDPKKPLVDSSAEGKEYLVRAESTIGFVASKVTSSHNGGFNKFEGKINVAGGKI